MESSNLPNNGADKAPAKKPYTSPTLIWYGKLVELTAGSGGKSVETSSGTGEKKP